MLYKRTCIIYDFDNLFTLIINDSYDWKKTNELKLE